MNPYASPTVAIGSFNRTDEPSEVPQQTIQLLRQTRPWVIVMSVAFMLGSAFMLFASVLMLVTVAALPSKNGMSPALALVYLPFGVLYIYPGIKLWSYGSAIGRLLRTGSALDLESALGHQKSFWKFSGIATVTLVAVYVLAFVVVVGVTSASMHQSGASRPVGRFH